MHRFATVAAALLACTASAVSAQDAAPAVTGPALVTGFLHLCGGTTDFDDAEALSEYGYAPVDPREEQGFYSGGVQGQIISRGEGHDRIRIAMFPGYKCQAWVFGENRLQAWEHLKFQLESSYGFSVVREEGNYTRLETQPRNDGSFTRLHVSNSEGTIPTITIYDQQIVAGEE